ncbi:MAG: hypothetical protein Q6351_001750, partial [Candidatus Njordarchaeum guaymaensis]
MDYPKTLKRLNYRIPLIMPFNEWFSAVISFYTKISKYLGENLIEIVAAPEEDALYHGYNVVILVKTCDPEMNEKIARIETEVAEEFSGKISISSNVTCNPKVVSHFLESVMRPKDESEAWFKALQKFYNALVDVLGNDLVDIAFAPEEDALYHGYNVVILVKTCDP